MLKLFAALAATFVAMPVAAAPTALASWYGEYFHGRTTANGETYNMYGISVAHKSLPFGTRLRLCNTANGKCVDATVNDRGPYIHGRTFDLSMGAAQAIGMIDQGVATVTYEYLN